MATSITHKPRIGFIGLGSMGDLMVLRLLQAGYPITVYNRTKEKAHNVVSQGATLANTPRDLAANVDYVISCLANYDAVSAIMYGPDGAVAGAQPGTVFIEMSTIAPDQSRQLAEAIQAQKSVMLDAPVAGSTPQAKEGQLVIFVGGNEAVYQQATPILSQMSKATHYMGEQGMGTTMKVVVNSLLTLEMQAIAEATALGEKAGIGREHLMNVLSQTTVIAPAHAAKLQNHKKGEYPTNFALYLAYKDLGLVRRLATQVSTSMPATAAAEEMYAAAVAHGYDSADFSVMMKFMDQMSNITPQD